MARWIIHVDMDEFFAAVEKLDNPELNGKPLLVGGDPKRRGVVSTASYEARAYGCRSAMPMSTAIRLCPQAVVLPVRMKRYREVSDKVFEILRRFTPLVEPASIDEAFLDVSGCELLFGSPETIGRKIKETIRKEIGLTASIGVAPNKFLAKLASDMEKPDGFVVIKPERVVEFLDPLPVEKLWGVGPATLKKFKRLGIQTIGQLRRYPVESLVASLGSAGELYHALANGIDHRPVEPVRRPKSLSSECTFPEDVADAEHLRRTLLEHVEEVARRLRRHRLEARVVSVKFRDGRFKTSTRRVTLPEPTNVSLELWEAARSIFEKWRKDSFRPLRLLGFCASGLIEEGAAPQSLLPDRRHERAANLDRAADRIAERFGPEAIKPASLLQPDARGEDQDEDEELGK